MSVKNQDKPLGEADGTWISAFEALQMLSPVMDSELAKTTIIDRAYAGLIASRAQHYSLIPRRGRSSNFQNYNLPNFFWHRKAGIARLSQNWQVGDFKQENRRFRCEAFGVSFRRLDITTLTSSRTPPDNHSVKLTALDEKKATDLIASKLERDPNMSRDRAKETLSDAGVKVSGRAFQSRVWPQARTRVGLPTHARSGRKKKRDR